MTCYDRALLMMLCLLEDSDKPVDVGGHTDWWGDQDSAPQGLVGAGYKLSDSSKKAAQTKLSALFLAFWGWKKKLQKDGSSPPTGGKYVEQAQGGGFAVTKVAAEHLLLMLVEGYFFYHVRPTEEGRQRIKAAAKATANAKARKEKKVASTDVLMHDVGKNAKAQKVSVDDEFIKGEDGVMRRVDVRGGSDVVKVKKTAEDREFERLQTLMKPFQPQAVEDSEMEKKKKLKAEQIATLKERLEYAASQEETADLRAQIRDALKSMSELQAEQARELQSQAQALAGAAGDPKSGAGDSERPSAVHGAGGDAHH